MVPEAAGLLQWPENRTPAWPMARLHHVARDVQPGGRRGAMTNGTDVPETECETPTTPLDDPRADWWAAPGEEVEETGDADTVLERPLLPLRVFMSVIGVGPPAYHAESGSYRMRWLSPSGVATLMAVAAVVALTAVATLSQAKYLLATDEDHDQRPLQSLKTIGVVIVGGYQVNALVQVLNTAAATPRHARLLTAWTHLVALHRINPTRGLRCKCYVQVVFMTAFIAAMLISAGLGRPRFVGHVLEGLAERMYLVPSDVMDHPAFFPAKVRLPLLPNLLSPSPLIPPSPSTPLTLPFPPLGGADSRVLCGPPPLRHQQELPVRLHHPLPHAAGRPHRMEQSTLPRP